LITPVKNFASQQLSFGSADVLKSKVSQNTTNLLSSYTYNYMFRLTESYHQVNLEPYYFRYIK